MTKVLLALACAGCLATASAHERLVKPEIVVTPLPSPTGTGDRLLDETIEAKPTYVAQTKSRSLAEKTAFVVLLPALVAIDIVTLPFQYVYVITHAR